MVATITFTGVKPSISTSNVALNANPGTVLKTARDEDFKTHLTLSKKVYVWVVGGGNKVSISNLFSVAKVTLQPPMSVH